MTTQVTLPYGVFSGISEIEFDGVSEVLISLGCADFAKRDIDADGFAVYLSLKTPKGKFLGNGAYAGAVTAIEQNILEQLWTAAGETLSKDELYLSAGANEGDLLDEDGQAICSDCLSAGGNYDEETTPANPDKGCACWSCSEMIAESMDAVKTGREEAAALEAWEAAQAREWAGVA